MLPLPQRGFAFFRNLADVGLAELLSCGDIAIRQRNIRASLSRKALLTELATTDSQAAQELFDKLSQGGTPADQPTYPGTGANLPGGGFIGYHPASKSGPPAIDINIPGIDIGKNTSRDGEAYANQIRECH